MISQLSPIQIRTLGELSNNKLDAVGMLIQVGYNWRRAVRLLEERGLIAGGHPWYRLTDAGKREVQRLLKSGDLILEGGVNGTDTHTA